MVDAASDPRARGPIARALAVAAVAAAWRLWLMGRYAGWEESDYGNLAMVRAVLDGRFLHYDMSQGPGYYGLGAVVLALVGDAVVAARAVSFAGGVVAAGLATAATERLFGARAALLAGLLLVFQPEFALYASTSLREPVYCAFVVGCVVALGAERLLLAGALAGAAFLVRFDGIAALLPVLALHAWGRAPRGRRLAVALSPLLLAALAWSAYCRFESGTFLFWSHPVAVNVETGLGGEHEGALSWALNGLRVAGTLLLWLLPSRIGWATWAGVLAALALAPWGRHGLLRTWTVAAVTLSAIWALTGLVGQHEPDHNLYWKWLTPLVPVLVPLGAGMVTALADRAGRRLGRPVAALVLALAAGQAVTASLCETSRQVDRAERWYRPQLDLAVWIEANVPPDVPLLLDQIPARWIDRRPHGREILGWADVDVSPGDPEAFGRWLLRRRAGWVMWFREEWTLAPRVAPFLAGGGTWEGGGARLTEVRREDGYGWIFFSVEAATEG